MLAQQHEMAKNFAVQTGKAVANAAKTRHGARVLASLGDTIKDDDVLGEASKLIGAGVFSPHEAAVLLTDMPKGGPGLSEWVKGHLAAVMQNEAGLAPHHALAQHEAGTSAMRLLLHANGALVPPAVANAASASPGMGAPANG